MTTVVSFIVVIGVLILIHELGHFIMARLTGVGVERFSIGFGPVLLRWRGKETEYCLSAIPMGGYVKMVGEENPLEGGGSAASDPAKAFATKPLWARFLIVFAGPAMNFVLAAVIFAIVLGTVGRPVWPAVVGKVAPGGPAAALQSGDLVVRANGEAVRSWEDLDRVIAASHGRPLQLVVKRAGVEQTLMLTPRHSVTRDPIFKEPRDTWDIGAGPQLTPQIGIVNGGSPAERAGLKPGDVILAVSGEPVFTPEDLMLAIQKRPGQTFDLTVERGGQRQTLPVSAERKIDKSPSGEEVEVGRIGVSIVTRTVRYEPYSPLAAVWYGGVRTWDMTAGDGEGVVEDCLPPDRLLEHWWSHPDRIRSGSAGSGRAWFPRSLHGHHQREPGRAELAAGADARRWPLVVLRHRSRAGPTAVAPEARGRSAARIRAPGPPHGVRALQRPCAD